MLNDVTNKKGQLLLEFFTEEIPARFQIESENQLEVLMKNILNKKEINYEEIKLFSGPRHLAIIIKEIDLQQNDQTIEKRGPRIDADQRALNGFLNANKIELNETELKDTKNGKFYFYSEKIKGLRTSEILPDIIHEIAYGFRWSKSQRWSNTKLRWGRPLRNILLVLNDNLVQGSLCLGNNEHISFNNYTYGHRHYEGKKIIVKKISNYKNILADNNVILSRADRKSIISESIDTLLKDNNLSLLPDKYLLEEVVGLVEFPNVLLGSISSEFMSLPPEVLSTAMKVHQKYFSTINEDNELAPYFIFVSNSLPELNRDANVIEGNERVLKARLSDASFFWKTDLLQTFDIWNNKLKNVIFYEGLGSLYDKTLRLSELSKDFFQAFNVEATLASQAALLSKADLVSEMVGEFPDLQGIMGGYYCDFAGNNSEVSQAIKEHYQPKGLSDQIPKTNLGGMLSLIDKIDTLTCFFKIGKKPTGSKDPFALRRSASGIVKLLTEFNINISLNNLFLCSLNLHNNVTKSLQIELIDFIIDRLKISLKNKDIKNDIINSILLSDNINNLSFQIILQRINILSKKNEDERFKNFLHNFKRLNNILKPNDLLKITSAKVNPNLLENNNEKDIFLMLNNFKSRNTNSEVNVDIQEKVLNEIIDFGDPISNFFGTVTVNVKDVEIKKNRLCLLYIIREEIIKYSNFHLMDD